MNATKNITVTHEYEIDGRNTYTATCGSEVKLLAFGVLSFSLEQMRAKIAELFGNNTEIEYSY